MWLELGDNIPPRLVTTILNALFLASLARLVIVLVCCADILLPTAYTLIYIKGEEPVILVILR